MGYPNQLLIREYVKSILRKFSENPNDNLRGTSRMKKSARDTLFAAHVSSDGGARVVRGSAARGSPSTGRHSMEGPASDRESPRRRRRRERLQRKRRRRRCSRGEEK